MSREQSSHSERIGGVSSGPAVHGPRAVLHFPEPDVPSDGLAFVEPVEVVEARRVDEVRGALAAVERAAAHGLHAVGFVGYEAAPAFDPALAAHPPGRLPLVWFGLFREAVPAAADPDTAGSPFRLTRWTPSIDRARYDADIASIRDAIGRGDVYQVNHTFRLRARLEGDARAFHRRMLAGQGGGYGAWLDLGRHRILSASPELFFRRSGTHVVTRPMKGTVRRGRWPAEDEAAARRLEASEKDLAENLMIVDLLRNDLGRIARFGTVHVPRLFEVERYPTVHQMTSTIEAELPAGTPLHEIFAALFPCGSVTGAPKIAAMRRIAALETAPREVYCGAIGWVRPGGDCTFSVAIRTAWLDTESGALEYGTGGGITWDSTPDGEYDEAHAKATLLTREMPAFDLLETLRLDDGRYARLDRHMARLGASAAYFGRPDPREAARAALERLAAAHPTGAFRVRLLVDAAGEPRVECEPLPHNVQRGTAPVPASVPGTAPDPAGAYVAASAPRLFALAARPVSRRDPFLFHKTTHRRAYETRRAERADVFDVLLQNEEGELTEFTRGNLVVDLDGALCTPPLDCGLLPGTFRAELLERDEVRERVLRPADLDRARSVWLVNSVREWVRVHRVG